MPGNKASILIDLNLNLIQIEDLKNKNVDMDIIVDKYAVRESANMRPYNSNNTTRVVAIRSLLEKYLKCKI